MGFEPTVDGLTADKLEALRSTLVLWAGSPGRDRHLLSQLHELEVIPEDAMPPSLLRLVHSDHRVMQFRAEMMRVYTAVQIELVKRDVHESIANYRLATRVALAEHIDQRLRALMDSLNRSRELTLSRMEAEIADLAPGDIEQKSKTIELQVAYYFSSTDKILTGFSRAMIRLSQNVSSR